jgi:hypothetical protein
MVREGFKAYHKIEQRTETVSEIKEAVEEILQNKLGNNSLANFDKYRGKITAYPYNLDDETREEIDNFGIAGFFWCRAVCNDLLPELQKVFPPETVHRVFSANPELPAHYYLIVNKNEEEVIIDPTIGQFLDGHNFVFVGTREQLRERFFSHQYEFTDTAEFYRTDRSDHKRDDEELFLYLYGNSSKIDK